MLSILDKEELTESFNLNMFASLLQCVANPYPIYHKDFINEFGPKVAEVAIRRLKETPDKQLRDIRREKIEAIIKGIDNI